MFPVDNDYLLRLRRSLITHLDLEDLKLIVRHLDFPWDDLPGSHKTNKVYSLIMLVQQNGRFADLLSILQQVKGEVNWLDLLNSAVSQEAVQGYMEQMTDLLESNDPDASRLQTIVKKETSNILKKLDGPQKGSVLRFLRQSGLAEKADVLDISQADLRQADLREFDLAGTNLIGANLMCANLSKANLRYADLRLANLRQANLGGADLTGADLSQTDLREAHLWGAKLNQAKLYDADLSGARLSGASLAGADLRQANLDGAYLWNINLDEADLRGAKNTTAKQLSLAASMARAFLPDGRRKRR
ncbi:MAG: pentapeptide repeat-containing protein [Ardenticatenaceae bacterium]|nr:pentapeptide repeat-containing protein [Ardenticatenaceae bacterium]